MTPDFTDPDTGGPLPGREDQWSLITGYRGRIAIAARDWPAAATLLNTLIASNRDQAAAALAAPPASLTSVQRIQIRDLAAALTDLAVILGEQEDPGCLLPYQEALALVQRIGDRAAEAMAAHTLGNAYLTVPGLRDLDQAGDWFQYSLSLRDDNDQLGRVSCHNQLGSVALRRFEDALAADEARPVLLEHLNAALRHYRQALDLTPAGDHENRAVSEHQLGIVYTRAGDTGQALRHFQQAIQHDEERKNVYGAGLTRYLIALLLDSDGRMSDGLRFARAALDNFAQAGPGAADMAARAQQLIADLELRSR